MTDRDGATERRAVDGGRKVDDGDVGDGSVSGEQTMADVDHTPPTDDVNAMWRRGVDEPDVSDRRGED